MRKLISALTFLALSTLLFPASALAGGPPLGRYACYNYGFNMQAFYDGVTVVLESGSRYTTAGAAFTGIYRYVPAGKRIVYVTGKLRGLRSWLRQDGSKSAILIAFHDGNATNTAVCGRIH